MTVHFELYWTRVPLFDWTAEELKGKAGTEREGKREQIQSQDASKNTAFLSNGWKLTQVSTRRLSSDVQNKFTLTGCGDF